MPPWFCAGAGVRAARAAGIPVFGITSGQEPAVLLEAGCCMLLQDFTELVALAAQQCKAAGNGDGLAGSAKEAARVNCIQITADSQCQ
jgi:hypothetical protein